MGRKGKDLALVSLQVDVYTDTKANYLRLSRLIELNGMKASDEITEEQSRQASP